MFLSTCRLDEISLRSDGLVELANTIQDLPRLEVLELSGNKLAFNSSEDKRSTGIEAFCNALWQAPSLVALRYHSWYLMGCAGVLKCEIVSAVSLVWPTIISTTQVPTSSRTC